MWKAKYPLHFFHKVLMAVLLILGVCFVVNQKPYQKSLFDESNPENKLFYFLQEGDYVLEVTFEGSPKGNAVIVSSEQLTDSHNQAGVELARENISEGAGIVRIPFTLEQGTHDVSVTTEMDGTDHRYIKKAMIQSVSLPNKDGYFLGALCFAGVFLIGFLGVSVPYGKYRNVLVLIGLGMGASLPFLTDYLCAGDDLLFHITRLEGVYQAMRTGEFPVRINPLQSQGFGNLSATMYPQLFLYPAALLRFVGVSTMLCYKILVVCMNIGTALISFYSVKAITKSEKTGFAMSALYTFALYRLTNLYFRAALGESLAMVFLPLVIWGIYEILYGERKKWYVLVFGMTGVLQSHVLSFGMCIFFLILEGLFWLVSVKRRELGSRLISGLKATGLTILLNASFLIPFLYFSGEDFQVFHMESEVSGSGAYLTQMFQMFVPVKGMNLTQGEAMGEMPLSIGAVLAVGVILFVIAFSRRKSSTISQQEILIEHIGKHCLVYGLISLLLASWIFPWEKLHQIAFINTLVTPLQFAWRFLGPATVFLCIVSAVGVVRFVSEQREFQWVYGVMTAVLLCSTGYYFDAIAREVPQDNDKMYYESLMHSDGMYMYRESDKFEALQLNYNLKDGYIQTANGTEISCSGFEKKGTNLRVRVTPESVREDELLFPLYYYSGYEILMDGEPVEVKSVKTRVACEMPDHAVDIEISYKGFIFFRLGDIISLFSVLGMGIYASIRIFHVAKRTQKS